MTTIEFSVGVLFCVVTKGSPRYDLGSLRFGARFDSSESDEVGLHAPSQQDVF